jgi:diguanylate cyclase (GGDEF)-like protein
VLTSAATIEPVLSDAALLLLPSYISTALQTATTVLVAGLLALLIRVINRRFLRYWAQSWAALTVGLVALNMAFHIPAWSRTLLTIYWIAGDLFGFFLYIGCRDFAEDRPIRLRDLWLIIPVVVVGLVMPPFVQRSDNLHINEVFPSHALFIGGYCLLGLAVTLRSHPTESQTRIGLRLLQTGLLCLTALFWHYSVVMGRELFIKPAPPIEPGYMQFSALYDTFCELVLAFAQVLLATDSVRRELAKVSEQVALAARTDVLTGLLNRRAFESLLEDPASAPIAGSMAAIDVNDLKPLNDRLGHAVGDAALRAVARALLSRTRLGDPVFRMGGDEFLVMLPGVPAAELTRRLTDLNRSLANQRLPGATDTEDISVAWGVTEYTGRQDLSAAVTRADAAMYEHKKVAKNQPK